MLKGTFQPIRFNLTRSFAAITPKELVDAFTYCVQVVRVRDFENYLWCTQLPKDIRPGIFALRAFNVETASVIERAGTGDVFIQMRFNWWFDAITGLYKLSPPRNPVFIALAEVLRKHHFTRYRMKQIVETRLNDALRRGPPNTLTDLESYANGTAVQLLLLQVTTHHHLIQTRYPQLEVAGASDDEWAASAADYIGRAVGLTNLLRGTSHHAERGIVYLPKDLLSRYQLEEESVLRKERTEGVRNVVQELAERARELLEKVRTVEMNTGFVLDRGGYCGTMLHSEVDPCCYPQQSRSFIWTLCVVIVSTYLIQN
eukprot:g6676.t1